MSVGLLVVRLIFGLGMAAHGAQKLFGWFSGPGLGGMAGFMDSMGFRPGRLFGTAIGVGEFGSGVLIALGLLGPFGPALLIVGMIVAMWTVHRTHGFFVSNNGIEVPLLYIGGALAICATGPGEFSLDAVLGFDWLWAPNLVLIAVGSAVAVALLVLVIRRPVSIR